jgi:hypothetical protein
MRITEGDEVRVYYGVPGQVTSFVEGMVCRVDVTTTRGRGFLIAITRDVLLGWEQPIAPGYQHFVLYQQMEEFPGKVEVLSQAQREPEDYLERGSEPRVEQEPTAEAMPEPDQMAVVRAEQIAKEEIVPDIAAEAGGSEVQSDHQDEQGRGSRIIPFFRRK